MGVLYMKIVHKFFDVIWCCQQKIIKASKQFNSITKGTYKIFIRCGNFIWATSFIISLIFIIFENNNLFFIFFNISFGALVISYLAIPVMNTLLNCCTSLRNFFLVSVVFNGMLSYVLYIKYSLLAILVFAVLFFVASLIANTKIATTANTIIEVLLALASVIKGAIINEIYKFYNKQLGILSKEMLTQQILAPKNEYYSEFERTLSNSIDNVLYPLLVINGIAILVSLLHSYWIEKYNDNKQIGWEDIENLYP